MNNMETKHKQNQMKQVKKKRYNNTKSKVRLMEIKM